MYTLIGAKHRNTQTGQRWTDVAVADEPIGSLRGEFGDVWMFITWPSLDEGEYRSLRLDAVIHLTLNCPPELTVQQWLTDLGNMTLPWAETNPKFEMRYVQYGQAWHSNYGFTPIGRNGYVTDIGSMYSNEDLVIHHPTLPNELIGRYGMFTVNGLFHMVDWNDDRVIIREGNRSTMLANDNQIGLYSFQSIGSIEYIPIRAEDVHGQKAGSRLYDGVYLRIPESYTNLGNKTLLLVMGGYLHILGQGYQRLDDRLLRIDIRNFPLLQRYYDARRFIDMSSLNLFNYVNDGLLDVEAFHSNEVIRAFMALDQTFLVAVDSPTFFQELIPLDPIGHPSTYLDYTQRHLPIVGAYGRMLEHHRIYEEGQYAIAATTNWRHNYDAETYVWSNYPAVDEGTLPAWPYRKAPAYLRLMGVEK